MKYICKDCGAVYEEHPDYCDCGNNTFDIIDEPTASVAAKPKLATDKGELFSRLFLIFCLIVSIVILLFPVATVSNKPEEQPQKDNIKTEIPDIDTLWKEAPKPITQPQAAPVEPEPIVIIKKIVRKVEVPVKTTPAPKPVTQSKPQAQPKAQPQPQPKSKAQTAPKPVQKQEVVKSEPVKTTSNPNSPAVIRYKNVIRAILLSKLAVGSIPGEGTCVIKFRVNSDGKLVDRGFEQYANNKPMNDAIYYMLMSVPKVQPPPAEYGGEVIRLQFYINNGAYEISFK